MELIQPWNTSFLKANVLHLIDVDKVSTEIMALFSVTPTESSATYPISVEKFPTLVDFRDRVCTNLVKEFVRQTMGYQLVDFTVETFGKWLAEGKELGPHTHGSTGITTIFYPDDYQSGLVLYDPRGNACRGYPREIRDGHFAPYTINPKAGDLYVIPSYIQHYVPTVEDGMRLSLINDYMFNSI